MTTYNELAQKFISVWDNLKGLGADIMELEESKEKVPEDLRSEYEVYNKLAAELIEKAEKEFGKSSKELYKDGWDFWMEEDKQMREERYGKPEQKSKEMTLVYFPDIEEPLEVAQFIDYQEFKKITGKENPVEYVRLPNPAADQGAPQIVAIINEEGLLIQLPLNRGHLVGNIILAMVDPEDEEEIRGFHYHEEIQYAKLIMDNFFPRATEETEYPDPTPQFYPMDNKQFEEYLKSGKLPEKE